MIWVDSSALISIIDADQSKHEQCRSVWAELLGADAPMATGNYCVLETSALVQARMGMKAIRALHNDILPMIAVQFTQETEHASATSQLLSKSRRKVRLVDLVSFEMMRQRGIDQAFTLDKHYREEGFRVVPDIKKGNSNA